MLAKVKSARFEMMGHGDQIGKEDETKTKAEQRLATSVAINWS